MRVKIADFGLNKVFNGPGGEALITKCGTTNYMAPEITGKLEYAGPPVDIFACGAILFIMRFAKFAFGYYYVYTYVTLLIAYREFTCLEQCLALRLNVVF